jgi:GH24 family phage-related lysozyme (muramidase)
LCHPFNIGPEKLFSATVVRMVDTRNSAAADETRAALLRSITTSIDLVAKAICD